MKHFLLSLALLLTAMPLVANASNTTPSEDVTYSKRFRSLRDKSVKFLKTEGYVPTVTDADEDWTIKFKANGYQMILSSSPSDDTYLYLVLSFDTEYSMKELVNAYDAANHVMNSMKGIKVYFDNENDPIFSVELFLDNNPEPQDFLKRMIDVCLSGYERYKEKMKE